MLVCVLNSANPHARTRTAPADTAAELELVQRLSLEAGAHAAVVANHWAKGGAGATDLGEAVIAACAAAEAQGDLFKFLYVQSLTHANHTQS